MKNLLIFGRLYGISLDDPRENTNVVREVREELRKRIDGHIDFDILYSDNGTIHLLFLYDVPDEEVYLTTIPSDVLRFLTGEGYVGSLEYPIVDKDGSDEIEELQKLYEKNNVYCGGDEVRVLSTIVTPTMMTVSMDFGYRPLEKAMKKKVFLCGQTYDLSVLSEKELQNDIQKRINEFYEGHPDRAIVSVKIENGEVEVSIRREFVKDLENILPYKTRSNDEQSIFCIDSDLLLGRKFKDTRLVEAPRGVGFGYYYSWPVSEFVELYKKNCKLLKVSKPKDVKFFGDSHSVKFTVSL